MYRSVFHPGVLVGVSQVPEEVTAWKYSFSIQVIEIPEVLLASRLMIHYTGS